jgi:SAM-dependent methyltransferase
VRDGLEQELERYAAEARSLEGWELEYEPEPLEPGPPWDYEAIARERCSGATSVLDLGTGGGEVLSRILAGTRCRAVATEWWHVNAPVASRLLADRARVVRGSSLDLPFADHRFDLVLSRHEEINPGEVARVLARGGRFVTQQVVHDVWHELRSVFPDLVRFADHYTQYREGLAAAGLTIERAVEFRRPVRFRELGHLVYHLAAAPWSLPNFSVRSHREGLAELDRRAQSKGGLVLTEGFYLLEARAAT